MIMVVANAIIDIILSDLSIFKIFLKSDDWIGCKDSHAIEALFLFTNFGFINLEIETSILNEYLAGNCE